MLPPPDGERQPGVPWESATAYERADALEDAYLPISARGGDLLYILVRAKRPNTVVEFGTSYGISTIYLEISGEDQAETDSYFDTNQFHSVLTVLRRIIKVSPTISNPYAQRSAWSITG